jgi:hypothetical protein
LVRFRISRKNFREALKTQVKVRSSRPLCWHFCWYRKNQTFAVNFDIPNERIEQMARKNGGACRRAPKCQHSDRADVRFAPPAIQVYAAQVVDVYQWVCDRSAVSAGRFDCCCEISPWSLWDCPPKAKVTRSNRVGRASFFFIYNAICAPELKLQFCLIRASKQS